MRMVILVSVCLLSCAGIKAPSPNVVPPTIATVSCVYSGVSQCVKAGTPWLQCAGSVAASCGTDVATISQLWDAHVKAEVIEGFQPRAFSQ